MDIVDISHLDADTATIKLQGLVQKNNDVNCQIDFGTDHSQSKIIRDFIGYIFDIHQAEAMWRWRFILITDELINNAIEHGSARWDLDSCIIHATEDEKGDFSITLEVHDTGRGKDSKDATHMEEIKNKKLEEHNEQWVHMEKRGRGLFYITEKLVDRLSFSESIHGGLAVRVEKNIALTKSN